MDKQINTATGAVVLQEQAMAIARLGGNPGPAFAAAAEARLRRQPAELATAESGTPLHAVQRGHRHP